MEFYEEYCAIHQIARDLPSLSCDTTNLINALSGTKFPGYDDNTFRKNLGDSYNTYIFLENTSAKLFSKLDYSVVKEYWDFNVGEMKPYSKRIDWEREIIELQKYLLIHRKIRYVSRKIVALLEDAIDRLSRDVKLRIPTQNLDMLKSLVNKLHDPALIACSSVTHIYNNGEITSQKGGEIYGHRSEFVSFPFIPEYNGNILDFPVRCSSNLSYAVVTDLDARKIREQMIQLVNSS